MRRAFLWWIVLTILVGCSSDAGGSAARVGEPDSEPSVRSHSAEPERFADVLLGRDDPAVVEELRLFARRNTARLADHASSARSFVVMPPSSPFLPNPVDALGLADSNPFRPARRPRPR